MESAIIVMHFNFVTIIFETITCYEYYNALYIKALKGHSTFFLEIGSFYHTTRVKQLGFTVFECILIFGRISVTRQFLVSLTSVVYFFSYYGSQ